MEEFIIETMRLSPGNYETTQIDGVQYIIKQEKNSRTGWIVYQKGTTEPLINGGSLKECTFKLSKILSNQYDMTLAETLKNTPNILTHAEAHRKICPYMTKGNEIINCQTNKCMFWQDNKTPERKTISPKNPVLRKQKRAPVRPISIPLSWKWERFPDTLQNEYKWVEPLADAMERRGGYCKRLK